MKDTTEKEKNACKLATIVELINNQLAVIMPKQMLDFAQQCVYDMKDRAVMYDAAAALNRSYLPGKSNVMFKQAECLQALVDYWRLSLEIGQMKHELAEGETRMEALAKMFSI